MRGANWSRRPHPVPTVRGFGDDDPDRPLVGHRFLDNDRLPMHETNSSDYCIRFPKYEVAMAHRDLIE